MRRRPGRSPRPPLLPWPRTVHWHQGGHGIPGGRRRPRDRPRLGDKHHGPPSGWAVVKGTQCQCMTAVGGVVSITCCCRSTERHRSVTKNASATRRREWTPEADRNRRVKRVVYLRPLPGARTTDASKGRGHSGGEPMSDRRSYSAAIADGLSDGAHASGLQFGELATAANRRGSSGRIDASNLNRDDTELLEVSSSRLHCQCCHTKPLVSRERGCAPLRMCVCLCESSACVQL